MLFLLINGGFDIVEVIGSTPTDPTTEKPLRKQGFFILSKCSFSRISLKRGQKEPRSWCSAPQKVLIFLVFLRFFGAMLEPNRYQFPMSAFAG